ncbi:MAG TPA: hypothetical protein VK400_04875 [Pyrinomonadaceae bacterium]|nr:hypothetical protein [Pyrinomonadaceae bacterium]
MKLILIGLFLLINFVSAASGQSKNVRDDKLYNDLRTIQGQIEILNHPALERTPGRNFQILFQRVDCKRCFISVKSDSEGKYLITVSKGKYRLIARGPKVTNGEYYDLLSPAQRRVIDASGRKAVVNFDIKITLPAD